MHGREACVTGGACPLAETTRYGQLAGVMYPTGMHTCLQYHSLLPEKVYSHMFDPRENPGSAAVKKILDFANKSNFINRRKESSFVQV